MTDKPVKMSKSDNSRKWCDKVQVFKTGGKWVYACQEGHGGGKYIPGASWELMYKIARAHMLKEHYDKENPLSYRSNIITLRS